MLSAQDKGEVGSHGAERQLDETELRHVDPWKNGNRQVLLRRVGERRTARRLNCFRSSHSPVLQGSSSDFRVLGTTLRMPSAKRKELAEFQLQTWTPVILTDPRFSEKCGTIVPVTRMANEKEMSVSSLRWRWGVPGALQTCPGGWLNQCCHLRKGSI